MKLSEVLINNKTIQYIDNAPVGMRYAVVDESMNRVISKHATKESAKKTLGIKSNRIINESPSGTPAPGVFPAGELFPFDGGRSWAIGLGNADEVIKFTDSNPDQALRKANEFLETIPESQRNNVNRLRRAVRGEGVEVVKGLSRWTQTLNRRVADANITAFRALENISIKGRTLTSILASPYWRGIGRVFGAVTISGTLIFSSISVLNDLENEYEEAERNGNQDEMQEALELRNILVGQISIQLLIALRLIFGNARMFNRALSSIKWTVRAIQGGAATTGVGAIPSAISFLVTESAWLIAGWVIASPTVQRAMAEWFHGNLMGVLLGLVGTGVVFATRILDDMFDGQYGTGALRNTLDFESRQSDVDPDAEFSSSSEWAKLVFHGLLFPPRRENLLVPYIGPEQRATLLRQTMGIAEDTAGPTGDSAADVEADDAARVPQSQPSEPGMPVNPDARTGPQ
jgi:hypothetical protein